MLSGSISDADRSTKHQLSATDDVGVDATGHHAKSTSRAHLTTPHLLNEFLPVYQRPYCFVRWAFNRIRQSPTSERVVLCVRVPLTSAGAPLTATRRPVGRPRWTIWREFSCLCRPVFSLLAPSYFIYPIIISVVLPLLCVSHFLELCIPVIECFICNS